MEKEEIVTTEEQPKEEHKNKLNQEIKNLTFTGILIALMFAFAWTVLGFIPLGLSAGGNCFPSGGRDNV